MARNTSEDEIGYWTQKFFVTDDYSPMACWLTAVLGFLLAIGLLFSVYASNSEFPSYDELHFQTGQISKIRKTKYSVLIELDNSNLTYACISKGSPLKYIYNTLEKSKTVTIGYIPSEKHNATIYDISVSGVSIRSHNEIKQAYSDDDDIVNWLAPLFLLLGLYMALVAHFTTKHIRMSKKNYP